MMHHFEYGRNIPWHHIMIPFQLTDCNQRKILIADVCQILKDLRSLASIGIQINHRLVWRGTFEYIYSFCSTEKNSFCRLPTIGECSASCAGQNLLHLCRATYIYHWYHHTFVPISYSKSAQKSTFALYTLLTQEDIFRLAVSLVMFRRCSWMIRL